MLSNKPPVDLREAFAAELGRVHRRWRTYLDECLKDTGLTQARWQTLLHLSRGGDGMTQRELADRLGIEGPTLVRLLDALEQQGLVARHPGEEDRRAKHVHLTGKGQPLLSKIDSVAAQVRQDILADVSPQELATCIAVFSRIADYLEGKKDAAR